jgi:hypothetical protein
MFDVVGMERALAAPIASDAMQSRAGVKGTFSER